jgi:hypothetical protein
LIDKFKFSKKTAFIIYSGAAHPVTSVLNPSQKQQNTVTGKAPVAEKAQHPVQDVSRLRRPATPQRTDRCIFEMGSYHPPAAPA